jgi:hypothetical protein
MRFETQYNEWKAGRATRSKAEMVGEDGATETVQFADLLVRQMTTRAEYEKHEDGGFQTLDEMAAEYLSTRKETKR